jgi:hypothetical protein
VGLPIALYSNRMKLSVYRNITVFVATILSIILTVVSLLAPIGVKAELCKRIYSDDSFLREQAALLSLEAKIFDFAYRFDQRNPEQIRQAKGFFPNPDKPDGGIVDHSKPKSMGTSRFVSLTYVADNIQILKDAFIKESGRSNKFPDESSRLEYEKRFSPDAIAALETKSEAIIAQLMDLVPGYEQYYSTIRDDWDERKKLEFTRLENEHFLLRGVYHQQKNGYVPPLVLEVYQYRAEQVFGVETSSIGVAHEKEIVTMKVPLDLINAYRKAYFILPGWMKIDEPSERHYETSFKMYLQGYDRDSYDIVFGPWVAF